ncbi:Uncharacterised protein [Candidatus Tiddalikarchaeum anstoanum]|nr:Uncharacterised protein [Candidatus Tiddalikarchaeum anstoanum]
MPVEGISLTTVFSLVTVGLALALSVFLGGYYLQPALDISKVIGGVAYDIATLYDIAYTMPGEVTMHYYGPSICTWNYKQPSNSSESFHCYSGEAVVIDDVFVDHELLYVYNDTYMKYDFDKCRERNGHFCIPADSYPRKVPAYGYVGIPFFNAQFCSYTTSGFSSCDYQQSEFPTSFLDFSFLRDEKHSVNVEDYSFTVTKTNVNDYYQTVSERPENPTSLKDFLDGLNDFYNMACDGSKVHNLVKNIAGVDTIFAFKQDWDGKDNALTPDSFTATALMLREGYRWHVYSDASNNPKLICQERIMMNGDYARGVKQYLNISGLIMNLNDYVIDYCFDISTMTARNQCVNITSVVFSAEAINNLNTNYIYSASIRSCLKPFYSYKNGVITLEASGTKYNTFTGACDDVNA